MPNRRDDDYFETDEFGEDIVPDREDELPLKPGRIWHDRERWEQAAKAQASKEEPNKPRGRGRQFVPGFSLPVLDDISPVKSASPPPQQSGGKVDKSCRRGRQFVPGFSPQVLEDVPPIKSASLPPQPSKGEVDKPRGRGRQFVPGFALRVLDDVLPVKSASLRLPPQEKAAPIVDPVPDDEGNPPWHTYSAEERARTLWESGVGNSPWAIKRAMKGINAANGYYSSLLVATYGEGGEGLDLGVKSWMDLRQERPHVYVLKKRFRRRSYKVDPNPSSQVCPSFAAHRPSRYLTSDEFVDLYSAVAFANRCGLILNCHITILWAALGFTDHDEVARELLGFTRRLRDWCEQRGFETVWIYSHENSHLVGLHSHVLLFVLPQHAKEFRAYAQWSLNKRSRINPAPGAPKAIDIKIRQPRTKDVDIRRTRCLYTQWLWFEYLCKGIRGTDKFAKIRRGASEFEQVCLGDLVRFFPQDPGHIGCSNRVGMSRNLSASRRARGFINEAILTRAPKFKSVLEMLNTSIDVRTLYSGRYYQAFLDQARELYSLKGINFDKALATVQGGAEAFAKKIKAVKAAKPVGVAGTRKRKRVLIPGRLRTSAETGNGKGDK